MLSIIYTRIRVNYMKTVVITGASTGIGHATVKTCLAAQYKVIATARNEVDLKQLEDMGAIPVEMELTNQQSVEKAASAIIGRSGGRIDALFNNAGYGLQVAMEDVTWDCLEHQLTANLTGPVMLTNYLLEHALHPKSKIVFNSSILGLVVVPFRGPYCISKYAVEAAADAYRQELASRGVDVFVIEPGPIEASFRASAVQMSRACIGYKQTRLDYTEHFGRLSTSELTKGTLPASAVASVFMDIIEERTDKKRHLVTRMAKLAASAKWLLGDKFDLLAKRNQPVLKR